MTKIKGLVLRHPLWSLLLLALVLRLGAYLFLNGFLFRWQFEHPDSGWYFASGKQLAEDWRVHWYWVTYPIYSDFLAALFFLLPDWRLWPELVNIFASSGTAVLAYMTIVEMRSVKKRVGGVAEGKLGERTVGGKTEELVEGQRVGEKAEELVEGQRVGERTGELVEGQRVGQKRVGDVVVRRGFGRGRAAWGAGLFVALDPYQIYLSTQLLKDTLILFAGALVVYAFLCRGRGKWLVGIGMLLTGLLRLQLALLVLPFAVVSLWRRNWSRSLSASLLAAYLLVGLYYAPSLLTIFREQRDSTFAKWSIYLKSPTSPSSPTASDSTLTTPTSSASTPTASASTPAGQVPVSETRTEFFEPKRTYTIYSFLTFRVPLMAYPTTVIKALFYPYPWEADNFREYFYASYSLFTYGLFFLVLLAASTSLPYLKASGWFLGIGILLAIALTFLVPAVGPTVRWRMSAFYMLTLAAGIALQYLPSLRLVWSKDGGTGEVQRAGIGGVRLSKGQLKPQRRD